MFLLWLGLAMGRGAPEKIFDTQLTVDKDFANI